MIENLVYIYGFHSSTISKRALALQQLSQKLNINFSCPALDDCPIKSVSKIEETLKQFPNNAQNTVVVAMSLGAKYLCKVLEETNFECIPVLLSPAIVSPVQDLSHQGVVDYIKEYRDELEWTSLSGELKNPDRYYSFFSDNDEFLDPSQLKEILKNTKNICYSNSDHSLQNVWSEIEEKLINIVQTS